MYKRQHQQTALLLSRVRPDWLPTRTARAAVLSTPGLILSLGSGLILGLRYGLVAVLFFGLLFGLVAAFFGWLISHFEAAERLSWSWTSRARGRLLEVVAIVLASWLYEGWSNGFDASLTLGWLPLALAIGLIYVLAGGLIKASIPTYVTPNEGIRRSIQNGLLVALIFGLIFGLLSSWLPAALIFGLIFGLRFGLGNAAQYGVLRLLLWRYRIVPLRYVHWLNYTVRLRLLYWSTSGGYVFIHRIVQDYFCNAVVDSGQSNDGQSLS